VRTFLSSNIHESGLRAVEIACSHVDAYRVCSPPNYSATVAIPLAASCLSARKQFCQLSAQLLVAGLRRGPDVPFGAVDSQSDIFRTQVVIHRVSQFLFAAQIMLGRLNGCVTKQELNLVKFSTSQVA